MDPLVEALQRGRLLHPGDHSLDGLPLTVFGVGFVLLIVTSLALRWTGRSWRKWYVPVLYVLLVWWAGVNMGRYGFWSGPTLVWTVMLSLLLTEPLVRTFRAALVPVDRDPRH
ncbi:MAG TPA: hypothetical protein VGF41_07510 [Myxococcaceae bacterium]|jgi:hypothetical protein